jgi:hypothetical protein
VKALGSKEEALSCIIVGAKQKWYRKQQNMKNQALLKAAKSDPRFREEAKKRAVGQ